MNIAGTSFSVHIEPDRDTPVSMAEKLCTEEGARIGVTTDTLQDCVASVSGYLKQEVDAWIRVRTLSIPLTIGELELNVVLRPGRDDLVSTANKLCSQYKDSLGITDENLGGCITPVTQYFQREVSAWEQEKTLYVAVTVEGAGGPLTFDIQFMPERTSAQDMAARLCKENKDALQLAETNDAMMNCIVPVTDYLNKAVQQW